MKFIDRIKGLLSPESRVFWILLTVAVPAIPAIGLSVAGLYSQDFQEWLIGNEDNREHGSTTIRNLGFIIAGLVALPLATWRGYVAHKQANTAQEQVDKSQQQVETAQRQAETAQQGLRNERYQKAAEMLGDEVLAVRLGGIYALQRLAEEDPGEYHIQIMSLFCSFVRHPTTDDRHEREIDERLGEYGGNGRRDDVEAVMRAIRERPNSSVELEFSGKPFHLDFQGARLGSLYIDTLSSFPGSNSFVHADFTGAKLTGAVFEGLNFENALFNDADLTDAYFVRYSHLKGTSFVGATLSGTTFSEVSGLTQAQLDQARAALFYKPKFEDTLDEETGEKLSPPGRFL